MIVPLFEELNYDDFSYSRSMYWRSRSRTSEMYLIKIGKHLVNLPLVLNYFYDDSDNLGGHFNISSDTRLLNPES